MNNKDVLQYLKYYYLPTYLRIWLDMIFTFVYSICIYTIYTINWLQLNSTISITYVILSWIVIIKIIDLFWNFLDDYIHNLTSKWIEDASKDFL